MGLSFSRIWERMFGKKEMRILMVGLDAAGKVLRSLQSLEAYDPNLLFFCFVDYHPVQVEAGRGCDYHSYHW